MCARQVHKEELQQQVPQGSDLHDGDMLYRLSVAGVRQIVIFIDFCCTLLALWCDTISNLNYKSDYGIYIGII